MLKYNTIHIVEYKYLRPKQNIIVVYKLISKRNYTSQLMLNVIFIIENI